MIPCVPSPHAFLFVHTNLSRQTSRVQFPTVTHPPPAQTQSPPAPSLFPLRRTPSLSRRRCSMVFCRTWLLHIGPGSYPPPRRNQQHSSFSCSIRSPAGGWGAGGPPPRVEEKPLPAPAASYLSLPLRANPPPEKRGKREYAKVRRDPPRKDKWTVGSWPWETGFAPLFAGYVGIFQGSRPSAFWRRPLRYETPYNIRKRWRAPTPDSLSRPAPSPQPPALLAKQGAPLRH